MFTRDTRAVDPSPNSAKGNKTMETIKIAIRWDSEASIKQAEKDKLALENKGFTQVNSFGGIFESVLIYANLN